jgi:hypothetical protein
VQTIGSVERAAAVEYATETVVRAHSGLAVLAAVDSGEAGDGAGTGLTNAEQAEGIAHTTLDMLVAAAWAVEGATSGPVTAAARVYERAAATPYRVQPTRWAPVAAELRTAARRLSRISGLSRRASAGIGVTALIVALAALLVEIAAWREQTGQLQQAAAARDAAALAYTDAGVKSRRHVTATAPSHPDRSAPDVPTVSKRRREQQPTVRRSLSGGRLPMPDPRGGRRSR